MWKGKTQVERSRFLEIYFAHVSVQSQFTKMEFQSRLGLSLRTLTLNICNNNGLLTAQRDSELPFRSTITFKYAFQEHNLTVKSI